MPTPVSLLHCHVHDDHGITGTAHHSLSYAALADKRMQRLALIQVGVLFLVIHTQVHFPGEC